MLRSPRLRRSGSDEWRNLLPFDRRKPQLAEYAIEHRHRELGWSSDFDADRTPLIREVDQETGFDPSRSNAPLAFNAR
jgi:hypothetical protein